MYSALLVLLDENYRKIFTTCAAYEDECATNERKNISLDDCNDQICLPVVAIDQGIEQHLSCHVTRVESLQASMMINVRP